MEMNDVQKRSAVKIRGMLNYASDLALATVRTEALRIMERWPRIDGFCMGMGTMSFTQDDNLIEDTDKRVKSLYDFLYEFNSELKITGNALRIDRVAGELVTRTDW
jgi:hypothetical protein